jgi:DNA-binding SARP family transcriptional activator
MLELRVLGPFEVTGRDGAVEVGGPRIRAVLARLAVAGGRTVGVRSLVTEVWGDRPPADAERTLRTYVSRLRVALRSAGVADAVVTRAPGYQLRVARMVVDAVRFERLTAAARQAAGPREVLRGLSTALGLWRGEALAEFDRHPVLAAEGVRLERARLAAVETRIAAALALGLEAQVVGELETLVAAHPTRERFWGQLMTALYRLDQQAEALAAFRTARTVLVEDHGVEPSAGLVEVHRRVLHQEMA